MPECTQCTKKMSEGYCIDGGETYYCSDKCLEKNMTRNEYLKKFHAGDETYWTEWEDVVYICNSCDEMQEDTNTCEQCGGSMRTVSADEVA